MATTPLSTQKPVALIPILKYSKVVNGMLCVEIANIDSLYAHYEQTGKFNKDYELSVSYLFKFKTSLKSELSDIAWKSIKFGTHNINHQNEFTLKLPLYLLSYSMSFNFTLTIFDTLWEAMNVINATSDNQLIHIPSILIQSQYSNGEHVQYCVENAGFVRSGTILDISENNTVEIRTDSGYSALNGNADIVNVDISKLYRYPTEGLFIVDITNRRQAETDLILKTNNADNISVFSVICDGLFDFYYYEADDFETEWHHFQFMSVLIATHIYAFLYGVNAENCHNYGIQCVFGDSYLFCEEQWKYHILRTYEGLKKDNLSMHEIQASRDGFGYTCDICRAELSWYDFMYHCQCTHHQHDFCLTCIHSLIQQYEELELFLTQILDKIINDDCIEEILTFCVGKVRKFDNQLIGISNTE